MDTWRSSGAFSEPAPVRLVDRGAKPEGTVLNVLGVHVGGHEVVIMAGPCAVESPEQLLTTAQAVKSSGASVLRGGAFKPRTSPYSFQGLKEEGLEMLAWVRQETGLPVVTEVMDTRQVDAVCRHADIVQVGSRHMHDYTLLEEVGMCGKPVLLKRGMSATLEELLLAAEYVLKQGNEDVMLCERGIRTFEHSTRNTLDLNAVPMLKKRSHLPVIVDPSHGTGHWWMVPWMSKAAVAVGADGLLVEVHCNPQEALSDGPQSLRPDKFCSMMTELREVAQAVGRQISEPRAVAD
ncbi:MAG: 3-deoxy-7-phosphoheptulonate synthase [Gemmatimonadales bacterium]|nr:3-deoxy-7-phosphoheptulonate synthase [Gemmatimonadales bacterium]NIN12173.1 3-deoxy-7-phosphoheptulonate synthase [Gemmatimonadales bacterium]NIN50594.1 3-deoxy-7-phosphoheptulonate synthase [Gemmatimonadales bacterium]NIP08058.1 3-deoxy-7-phosphoheptulonate synthase [Gemmatimonadales bacterium]NIR00640.1 3-deoxy-7-phosphoheptulonate synthase [Gemmatimonadales bacterium]